MGFFSAVKKFFGQKTSPAQPTEKEEGRPGQILDHEEVKNGGQEVAVEPDLSASGMGHQATGGLSQESDASDTGSETGLQEPAEKLHSDKAGQESQLEAREKKREAEQKGEEEKSCTSRGTPQESGATLDEVKKPAPEDVTDMDGAMLVALRAAEPKLSSWLAVILQDQIEANDEFWRRLRFLLKALEAPEGEIETFLADFAKWQKRMEYERVDEFRSELQYRLAIALDLEDEEDERNRLLLKLENGLAATRAQFSRQLNALFTSHTQLNEEFWEEMEEIFIRADMGYETAMEIVARLKKRTLEKNITETARVGELLREELEDVFKVAPRIKSANKPEVVLMTGVNGTGKTTTIAKLAYRDQLNGKRVLVVAADTFRAAAIEQLKVWADRVGADFYQKPAGSDPASVAWEGLDYALKNDIDVVYIDTAGRLQTQVNLMEELGKIRQVVGKKHPGSPHRTVLVLDATTGQNALSQAKLFKEGGGADEIIVTKLDGTAKGGVAIAVALREKLPITFVGLGEKMEDLRPFDGKAFANAILDIPQKAA